MEQQSCSCRLAYYALGLSAVLLQLFGMRLLLFGAALSLFASGLQAQQQYAPLASGLSVVRLWIDGSPLKTAGI